MHNLTRYGPLVVLLILVCSCSPNIAKLARRCAEHFPVKDDSSQVVVRIETDTILLPDSWIEYIDTTYCPPNLNDTTAVIEYRKVPVPGKTVVVQVPCQDRIIIRRDSALVTALRAEIIQLKAKLTQAQERKKNKRSLLWWLILIVGGVVAWRVLRK